MSLEIWLKIDSINGDFSSIEDFVDSGEFTEHSNITLCLGQGNHCLDITWNHPNTSLTFIGEDLCNRDPHVRCDCPHVSSTDQYIHSYAQLYGYSFVHEGRDKGEDVAHTNLNQGVTSQGYGKYTFTYDVDCDGCVESITVCSQIGANFNALAPQINKYGFSVGEFYHAPTGKIEKFNVCGVDGNTLYVKGMPKGIKSPSVGDSFTILPSSFLTVDDGKSCNIVAKNINFIGVRLQGKGQLVLKGSVQYQYSTHHDLRHYYTGGSLCESRANTYFYSPTYTCETNTDVVNCTYLGRCSTLLVEGGSCLVTGGVFVGSGIGLQSDAGSDCTLFDSQFLRCTNGIVVTDNATVNAKSCRISSCEVGVVALDGGALSSKFSQLDRLIGGPILEISDCNVGLRINQSSIDRHDSILVENNTLDLEIDGVVYNVLTNYVSGTLSPNGSKLFYSVVV